MVETLPTTKDFVPAALRQKVEPLLTESYAYMDSPVFKQRSLEKELFDLEREPELPPVAWYKPTRDEDPLEEGPARQLMSAKEERVMFLRFNFAKRKLSLLQNKIRKKGLTCKRATDFLEWHRRFEHYREYIVRTNLALVLAMVKRSRLGEADFAEIISEGNAALIRAVDKFNVDRGFKFSTYACRAIIKSISRTSLKASRYKARFPVELDLDKEKSDWADRRRDMFKDDCLDELKAIVDRNLADLSDTEQTVIRRRFNWGQQEECHLSLEAVGQIIGVTKERVRQIQNKALMKIRAVMEEGVLRTTPKVRKKECA